MSWHRLPAELHLAVVHRLPRPAVRALAATDAAARALCLPAIFADVSLPSADALAAFVRHVPPAYGEYVRSLAVCTRGTDHPTDALLALLRACTRLGALSLSLASSLDPDKAVPAFARLQHVRALDIRCWAREDVSPLSERLVVALAASLPSLAHLSLARITRSAVHVDPCDVPYDVPIVTNDFDVPPHPTLGSDLALPNLLRLPGLRTLELRDTWLGCDAKIELAAPVAAPLDRLVLTGSMYSADTACESQGCTAWVQACRSLRWLEIGAGLAALSDQAETHPPRVTHVHINASRMSVDDLSPSLEALKHSGVERISIAYEQEQTEIRDCDKAPPSHDEFARECALDDLQDWSVAVEAFLADRSPGAWSALARVDVTLGADVDAAWDL